MKVYRRKVVETPPDPPADPPKGKEGEDGDDPPKGRKRRDTRPMPEHFLVRRIWPRS